MSISISLSPLVIINITDHYTRFRYIKETSDVQVVGALLGKQEGRNIQILHCFETKYDPEQQTIDKQFTNKRLEAFNKMFPDFEFVGWYSTCTQEQDYETQDWEAGLHKQFEVFRENPLFLKMNVSMTQRKEQEKQGISKKEMPLTIFERNQEKEFVKCDYIIEPKETERIALDDAKKDVSSTQGRSHMSVNLVTILDSIKLLRKNIVSLTNIIKNVPEIRKNHDITRQLASICNRLPLVTNTAEYTNELFTEYSDTVLLNQLGVLNKAIEQVQEFNNHKSIKNINDLFFTEDS